MKYRKLRIAWSVVWGLAAVLLIALWVRSYSWQHLADIQYTKTDNLRCFSLQGRIVIQKGGIHSSKGWTFTSYKLPGPVIYQDDNGQVIDSTWFHIMRYVGFNEYVIPDWFLVLFTAALIAVPWLPFRFSLRTLLIATTLVAVVLGAIVYAVR